MPRESARPMPMMSSPPSPVISPTIAEIFDVPTSSPTRYRSLRATRSSVLQALHRRSGIRPSTSGPLVRGLDRPDDQLIAKPEIHVIDVLHHPLTQRGGHIHVRLQSFEKPLLAEMQQRRVTLDQDD